MSYQNIKSDHRKRKEHFGAMAVNSRILFS